HLRLHKLIVFWDNNNITIDGTVDLTDSTDQKTRFEASGWEVIEIDGHDPEEIDSAISAAKKSEKPTMIACKTHIAIGTAAQDTSKGHGALTDPELIKNAREVYQWSHKPFDIPKSIKEQWEQAGLEGNKALKRWQSNLENLSNSKRKEFERIFTGDAPKKLTSAIRKFKKESSAASPAIATRKSSELTLNAINSFMQETIGGSADLTGSNNTKSNDMKIFDKNNRKGRYIHYGIREHAMAAAMNGMALHGGIRPYGGTFMCFTDYARPAMRLAALMKIPTIFVMTHDSIGLGEDGPTHQPVEHLAISRSTPNTLVFRPADTIETAECWEIALSMKNTPSVLALSRQNLPTVRQKHQFANLVSKGAYILEEASKNRRVILIATGSEVSIALKARELLEDKGIGTRVVSMPCMELFSQQDETYKRRILPAGQAIRIGIEAGVRTGWDEWLLGHRARANKSS
ncbi:MAG: transketolase, partial [Rhodobacterales bacterium]|nr:transketolase [Rhodobacterales bacterium]